MFQLLIHPPYWVLLNFPTHFLSFVTSWSSLQPHRITTSSGTHVARHSHESPSRRTESRQPQGPMLPVILVNHHHSCNSFHLKTPFWYSAYLHPILSFLSHQMVQVFKHHLPPTSFCSFHMILSGTPSKFLSLLYQCCNTHHTGRKLPGSFCWQLTLSKDYQNNLLIEQSQG